MEAVTDSRALRGLNPAQLEAVRADDGPALVIAGAGSGKTRVLVHRIAHLLETGRARPGEILAITFTNRAANEMRERVVSLVGREAEAMWVMTFHSACARMLRSGADVLGYSRSFTIYDESDSLRLIKRCMEEVGADPKRFAPRAVRAAISAAKNTLTDPDTFSSMQASAFEEIAAETYARYERRLLESNAMDFDDLLVRTVNMFELDASALERRRRMFRHVLVDEYQDTNRVQYRLLQLLCGDHRNLFVVGDEDQSIYGFRHADIRNILDFDKDFPEATIYKLEQNYRSTQNILSAANGLVSHNRDRRPKELWTDVGEGDPISVIELADEQEEARWVANEIDRLTAEEGLARSDIAVFYRVNAMSRVLEDILTGTDTPYRVIGGAKFYERAEIKDVIAYLSLIANPADSVAFSRIVNSPRRGIGATSEGRLLAFANTTGQTITEVIGAPDAVPGLGPAAVKAVGRFASMVNELRERAESGSALAPLIERVYEVTGYLEALEAEERRLEAEGRIENLRELLNLASEFDSDPLRAGGAGGSTLEDFLQHVSLHSQQDDLDPDGGQVTLMTLHNAKGLEFEAVFTIGCEEGVFPHSRALDEGQEEEERRLCYVAITRARKHLALTHARTRRAYGGRPDARLPSRFLDEIPTDLVEGRSTRAGTGRSRLQPGVWARPGGLSDVGPSGRHGAGPARARSDGDAPKFEVGEAVAHKSFGEGEVVAIEQGDVVVVRFTGGAERKLMAGYAPLERRDGKSD